MSDLSLPVQVDQAIAKAETLRQDERLPILARRAAQGDLKAEDIPADLHARLPELAHIAGNLARPADEGLLNKHLMKICALVGMSTHVDDRADWIEGMIEELSDLPASLVIEALEQARKRKTALWDYAAFVQEYCEEGALFLKKRAESYAILSSIAAGE